MASISVWADVESSPITTSTPVIEPQNPNAGFIGKYNYFQNPYNWVMSGGGTLNQTESQIEHQNIAERLFTGGTYNVFAGATYNQWDGNYQSSGKSYGGNIFAQTGQIGGFSAGGVLSVMNPFSSLNSDVNPISTAIPTRNASYYIPTFTSTTISEAFVEYQYKNVVDTNIGYIAFDNSPWLAGNMYTNMLTVPTTYQGAGVNVYAGNGWILSALAFNGAQFGAQSGFTPQTNYTSWLTQKDGSQAYSNGTAAIGANYVSNDGNVSARVWGYQFDNYGTMLYGDGNINLPISGSKHSFNIGAQFGTDQQWFQASNAMTNAATGAGNIQSYVAGIKAGWAYNNYEWQLNLSANTMWGPNGSWGGGAFVSPYTQSLQVDPLYAEAWSYNMVTQGQPGNMYKAQGQFALGNWGQNLIFQPVYVYVANNNPTTNGLQELDLVMNYPLPQVRGLYLFGAYAQQWYNPDAINVTNNIYQPIEIQSGIYYTW